MTWVSFANWDEIIETCVSYSTSLHSFASLSHTPKHQVSQAIEASGDIKEFRRLDGPDPKDSWTNKPYDDMPAYEYVYNSKKI
ncbi:hypothetical protein [Aneurinibacillus aneurinilyticus]|uniref:hypothetical protein n=1 Tax=Aneurinibacillus aneurinilyticus TaxID=1391 RepID=UPI0023F380BC|nr:hypothetical protein [Aneurinibacillus aneurinilyticus]